MAKFGRLALRLSILMSWISTGASGQGTKREYDLAASLPGKVADKVLRELVQPVWQPDGSFWYRVKTGPGSKFEWVYVDPVSKSKTVVIDSDRLKSVLPRIESRTTGGNLVESIARSKDHPGAFLLKISGERFRWTPGGEKLDREEPKIEDAADAAERSAPRASLRQGPETFVTFVNSSGADAHLQWIDPEGKPKGYGHLKPGEERRQHTFGGHVWRVFDDKGNDLAWIEAEDEPTTVEIRPARPAKDAGEAKEKTSPRNGRDVTKRNGRQRRGDGGVDSHPRLRVQGQNLEFRNSEIAEWKPLTTDGIPADAYRGPFRVSPDGKKAIALRVKPPGERTVKIIESSPADQFQPKEIAFDYLKPGDEIERVWPVLVDLEAGKVIPVDHALFENPWSLDRFHWSGDSAEFYFLYNQRGHKVVRLVGVKAADGAARTVVEEKYDTFVDYPNKIWMHWTDDSKTLLWMSERSGFNHLYRVDVQAGKIEKPLTSGEFVVRKVERIDDEAQRLWFTAGGLHKGQDPYQLHLASVKFDGSEFRTLTDADGNHSTTFSPDGKTFLDRYSSVDLPPVHEMRSSETGELLAKLESADASALVSAGWTVPERFVAKGRDGVTDIYGVIYRPSHFDPAKKYPVVEEIYAGPHGAHVPKAWGLQMRQHQMAELGFVVVQIDGMGTNWRSKAFHDVAAGNLADAGFPDRKAWIRKAAETRPWMDLSRVGIYGGSAGGQNAMRALIDHHDFYQVAVADCGCHDNRMDKIWWNELWLGWPVGPQYEASSNTVHAHKMQGKLMLVVGELDRNVDPASTMQVASALVKADKDFELLVVPGAGHGSAETPYGSRRRADFLVRHLYGAEPRRAP
ncbi:prolyl oligopeptidase family serine peptidase [bacterium]|nr:prolyl oligopeptidase family serine peptidase [bacterium]